MSQNCPNARPRRRRKISTKKKRKKNEIPRRSAQSQVRDSLAKFASALDAVAVSKRLPATGRTARIAMGR